MTQSLLATRAANIHARTRSARWSGVGHYHLDRWTVEDGAWLGSMFLAFVGLLYEPWLFGLDWIQPGIPEGLARTLLWVPVVGFGGSAGLGYRLLQRQTPQSIRPVGWVIAMFSLLAGLPLAGIVVLPVWRSLVKSRPRWAFQVEPDRPVFLTTTARPAVWRITERVFLAQITLLASFLVGVAGLFALGTGLGRIGALRPSPGILFGFTLIHLAGLAGSLRVTRRDHRDARSAGPWRHTPWFWLVPVIGPLLAVGLGHSWDRSRKTNEGVVWSAHAERTSEKRSRGFRTLASALTAAELVRKVWRPRFGLPKSTQRPRPGLTVDRFLSFSRWQTLFLAVEAGLLIHVANGCAIRWPASQPSLSAAIGILIFTAIGLASAGFAAWLALLGVRTWRQSQSGIAGRWQDAAYSFGLSHLALLAGGGVAIFFATEEDPRRVWAIIALTGAVSALGRTIFILVGTFGHSKERSPWTWAFAWLLLGGLAALATRQPHWSMTASRILAVLAVLTPLWHLLLVRARGDWLLWPVSWREAFDPRFPADFRWRLRLVAIAAALPFGGLLAPLWPFVRARLAPSIQGAWWAIECAPTSYPEPGVERSGTG